MTGGPGVDAWALFIRALESVSSESVSSCPITVRGEGEGKVEVDCMRMTQDEYLLLPMRLV